MEGVKSGLQQSMIHESAWQHLSDVESCKELVVGVNTKLDSAAVLDEGMVLDSNEEINIVNRLEEIRTNRNEEEVKRLLSSLEEACSNGENVMDPLIGALKAEATVGEVNGVFRKLFGTWMAPSGV